MLFVLIFSLAACSKDVKIKFNTNGGTSIKEMKIIKGDAIGNLPIPEKNDYFFEGWYLEPSFTTEIDNTFIVKKNIKLYAKWIVPYSDFNSDEELVLTCLIDFINTFDYPNRVEIIKMYFFDEPLFVQERKYGSLVKINYLDRSINYWLTIGHDGHMVTKFETDSDDFPEEGENKVWGIITYVDVIKMNNYLKYNIKKINRGENYEKKIIIIFIRCTDTDFSVMRRRK